jgi:hypothetical protein
MKQLGTFFDGELESIKHTGMGWELCQESFMYLIHFWNVSAT